MIILHGLYGSSDNWMTIAGRLGAHFHVYLPDLRNHGQSPHNTEHNYQVMCEDLDEFIRDHNIHKPVILGHSMGGKVAMFYAACHEEEISGLVVVDISPRTYVIRDDSGERFSGHKKMMEALLALDLTTIKTRQEALNALENQIPSLRVRQFLLKNLTRDKNNHFRWRLNLEALYQNLPAILDGLDQNPDTAGQTLTGFPVLFIRGSESNYIQEQDMTMIKVFFPYADIITIPESGHWVHAEQPDLFVETVTSFLLD